MYMNAISACNVEPARLPMVLPSDREAIQVAAFSCGILACSNLRLVRTRSTLKIEEFYFSEALVPELKRSPNVEVLGDLGPLAFDESGNLF
jgi:hypothetical protein